MKVWLHSTEELRNSFQFDENFLRTIFIVFGIYLNAYQQFFRYLTKATQNHINTN